MALLFLGHHFHEFLGKDVDLITFKTKNGEVLEVGLQFLVKLSRVLVLVSFKLLLNLIYVNFFSQYDEFEIAVIALIVIKAHQERHNIGITLQCVDIA
jgi:hypothetical protein